MSDTYYLFDGTPIHVPDNDPEIKKIDSSHRYEPTKGFGWSLLVFDESNICIGWIKVETLGYDSVGAWMVDNGKNPCKIISPKE